MARSPLTRLLRWSPVALSAAVAVAALAGALVLSGARVPTASEPLAADASSTPVLSARRVPALTGAPIADRRLAVALGGFIEAQDATTCLAVRSDDDVLFEHRATEAMIPASTQKLLVAAGVLIELGPDATFETIVAGGSPDANGVVAGDLFLVGGGDPLLATGRYAGSFRRQPQIHTEFGRLADQLVAAGLKQVTGGIVGDEGRYDTQRGLPIPEVWLPEDLVADVTGPLSALHVDDGFVAFPGDGQGTPVFEEALDPAAHAAQLLTNELRFRGVTIGLDGRAGSTPDGAVAVTSLPSLPLRMIVAEMLQESDNSTAELLLKELGLVNDRGGSSVGGAEALTAELADAGFTMDGTRVLDGSGVANGNLTTCRLMAEILTDERVDETIVDGLAVAGESGTLANRFRDTELAGHLRAKTGSLRIVSALAGEVDTAQGETLQFAYLINVEPGRVISGDLFAAQQQLGLVLRAHPDLPDAGLLGPR